MKKTAVITAMVVTAWMFNATAADEGGSQGSGGGQQQGGRGGEGGRQRPPPPIMKALDADGDRVISAEEIAGASAALLKLDKNGDGKLTEDEIRPPRPPRPDGEQGGQGERGGAEGSQDLGGQRPPPSQDGPEGQQ